MKKLILGVGLLICGTIGLCTAYAVEAILGAMPGVTLVGGGAVPAELLPALSIVLGAVLAAAGFREK